MKDDLDHWLPKVQLGEEAPELRRRVLDAALPHVPPSRQAPSWKLELALAASLLLCLLFLARPVAWPGSPTKEGSGLRTNPKSASWSPPSGDDETVAHQLALADEISRRALAFERPWTTWPTHVKEAP